MKTFFSASMIIAFLMHSTFSTQAQTTQPKLNQVELMKQFIGNWKGMQGKDTIIFWTANAYGTGFDCSVKFVIKGKIIFEQKQIWGYDRNLDKFIGAILQKGQDIWINAWWFTSTNDYVSTSFKDISNYKNASFIEVGDCKFMPDSLLQTNILNGKAISTYILIREK